MRISEVVSRLRSLASAVGDVDVVILSHDQLCDDASYYENAIFEIQNVTKMEKGWIAFEKDNRDPVVCVY